MHIHKLPYEKISGISAIDLAYLTGDAALRPFYKYPPELPWFEKAIADKARQPIDRETLATVLRDQHAHYGEAPAVKAQIEALASPRTFTVTTAHQPCLFTGPLYYIYKIVSAIELARQLAEKYPDYRFVPVFISGGEDHDFEEINHCHLFGKTLRWEQPLGGPVGKLPLDSLRPVLDQLRDILGDSEEARQIYTLIERTHTTHADYGTAACHLAHELFKDHGLVVLNASDERLKALFVEEMKREILEQVSHDLVSETIRQLNEAGFQAQANPREINFFYLGNYFRERIVFEDGLFKVLHTDLRFTPAEMEREIETRPGRFSPNVVMRPLFQEKILPNLAYVGGGGELAYWLERKRQFEHFGIEYPILVRRNSALWIDANSSRKLHKLGIEVEALFQDIDALIRTFLQKNAPVEIELNGEKEQVTQLFERVAEKATAIDPTLKKTVLAEGAKVVKSLEFLEVRLMRAGKQRHEQAIEQLRKVYEKLFPNNGLQERHDNFMPLWLRHGPGFFEALFQHLDPLEKRFVVFEEK
ncbi:MAG: putative cysteine ligase BshC [Saprospiraceae bacterium]|nr:MAG: putative cysteine ligase BshC [Saprospiraceae bacterium]